MNPQAFGIVPPEIQRKRAEWAQGAKDREITRLKYELQNERNKINGYKRRAKTALSTIRQLQDEARANIERANMPLEEKIRSYGRKIGSLQNSNNKLKRSRDALRVNLKKCQNEIDRLCKEIVQLRKELERAKNG